MRFADRLKALETVKPIVEVTLIDRIPDHARLALLSALERREVDGTLEGEQALLLANLRNEVIPYNPGGDDAKPKST
jgi:hypothetical protein